MILNFIFKVNIIYLEVNSLLTLPEIPSPSDNPRATQRRVSKDSYYVTLKSAVGIRVFRVVMEIHISIETTQIPAHGILNSTSG